MLPTGVWHDLPAGERMPYSLANNYDPDFNPASQYSPQARIHLETYTLYIDAALPHTSPTWKCCEGRIRRNVYSKLDSTDKAAGKCQASMLFYKFNRNLTERSGR